MASSERAITARLPLRRWPGFKRGLVIERLLTHYGERVDFDKTPDGRWSNQRFMGDFVLFIESYRHEFDSDPVLASRRHLNGPIGDEVTRLADRWGLRASWAADRLIREAAANVRMQSELPTFPLLPMALSRIQQDELDRWRERELDRNIEWLYRRIALRDTPMRIMHYHNDHESDPDKQVQLDAVEEGIRKLARLLDLTLPRSH